MSYIEDAIFIYSEQGWESLIEALNNLSSEKCDEVKSLLNSADTIRVSFNCDRMFKFIDANTNSDSFLALRSINDNISPSNYLGIYTGEGSTTPEEYVGDYWDNPFNAGVQRIIYHDNAGNDFSGDDMFAYLSEINTYSDKSSSSDDFVKSNDVSQIINDHTCVSCGNTKCSKSEKSCWRCGSSI